MELTAIYRSADAYNCPIGPLPLESKFCEQIMTPRARQYPVENDIYRISTKKSRPRNHFRHSYPLAQIYAHSVFGCLGFSGQPDEAPIPDATGKVG